MSDSGISSASAAADTYGVYRVLRPLGEGATGRVFLAERTDFAQRVALKVFHSEFLTAGLLENVDHGGVAAEQHLLASLDHRHIVRVLQQGVTAAGVRYLAMEYVDGQDILAFCDVNRLPIAARVRLLLQVLEAVEHAHRHLIVHGDLKPANILVSEAEDPLDQVQGEAKLVDFGAAALLGTSPTGQDAASAHPHSLTPAFASPEQRAGARTTVASDVYSLGLVARLLLAGVAPRSAPGELPSRALARIAQIPDVGRRLAEERSTTPSQLAGALRGDLDAIVCKALAREPEDRYLTAEAMAADLRAYAEGRTIAARQAPLSERLRKWTLRHRLGAAMATVLLGALLFSTFGITLQAGRARRNRREAEARLRELVQLTGTLQSELYGSVRALPNAGAAQKLLTDSAAATLDKLADSHPTDPTLRRELAAQFAQLARLELEQGGSGLQAAAAHTAAARAAQRSLELTPLDDPARPARAALLQSLRSR